MTPQGPRLEALIQQLTKYVGALQVEESHLRPDDPHYQEIVAALKEVESNLEWCLTLKPELEENGILKRNPKRN